MKKLFLATSLFFFINIIDAKELNKIKFCIHSTMLNDVGYNNSDVQTNGELQIIQNLITNSDTVVEIGSLDGLWATEVNSVHKKANLYAVELDSKNINFLKQKLNNQNIQILDAIYIAEENSSILIPSIKKLCHDYNIPKINFLKIKNQNHELEIIKKVS